MLNISRYKLVGSSRAAAVSDTKQVWSNAWSIAQPPSTTPQSIPAPAAPEHPRLQQQKKEGQAHHVATENLMTSVPKTPNSCNGSGAGLIPASFYYSGFD